MSYLSESGPSGILLTELTHPDREEPDLTSLADLGRVISKEAMAALDLVHDLQQAVHQTIPTLNLSRELSS